MFTKNDEQEVPKKKPLTKSQQRKLKKILVWLPSNKLSRQYSVGGKGVGITEGK